MTFTQQQTTDSDRRRAHRARARLTSAVTPSVSVTAGDVGWDDGGAGTAGPADPARGRPPARREPVRPPGLDSVATGCGAAW